MKDRLGLRRGVVLLATAAAIFILPARLQATTQGADAVVLVNSASAKFPDFQHYLQPYLDNFGVPYTLLDIASNSVGPEIGNYSLIIVGHSQLDTTQAHLTAAAQSNLVMAVSNGTGLVNFDGALTNGVGTNGYPYVKAIFGFGYSAGGSAANFTFPATEPGTNMHYITSLHAAASSVPLKTNLSIPGVTYSSNVTALVLNGGTPVVLVKKFGQGRAVQWTSYGWIAVAVKGQVAGLDDLVWRSLVWAARKPFVMRGLPNMVTMRVDDCDGPFPWAQMAIEAGFKPYIAFYISQINESNTAVMRDLVTNGNATASIHSFASFNLFYANQGAGAYPDATMNSNIAFGLQWHTNHGIPISKVVAPHYSEIGANAFPGLVTWGVEFMTTQVVPGAVEYATPGAPWLMVGPYRLYETPQPAQVALPFYYADFLPIPGHPELNGKFFNCVAVMRDDASCAEWCPDNDVNASIGRGTRQVKRELDSMTHAMLFTHEWHIDPIPGSTNAAQTNGNSWRAILQGITNNLAPYKPQYVTLDYAYQYIRATRTSRLLNSTYDPDTGLISASFSGYTDLATKVHVYVGEDAFISPIAGDVPEFTNGLTVSVPVQPALQGTVQGDQFVLSFDAVTNTGYTVDYATTPGLWSTLTNITAATTNVAVTNPIDGGQKLFRVSTPGH